MSKEQTDKIQDAVRKERKGLLAFIRSRVKTEEDAEDILQDVFVQLTQNHGLVDQIERLTSWLFTVARNKIIDSYRKKKPDSLEDLTYAGDKNDLGGYSPADLFFDPADLPDDQYTRGLVWEVIEDTLSKLPESQREVFVMHELDGLSFKAIAEITGLPVNTLISRKRYAIVALRERLRYLYNEIVKND